MFKEEGVEDNGRDETTTPNFKRATKVVGFSCLGFSSCAAQWYPQIEQAVQKQQNQTPASPQVARRVHAASDVPQLHSRPSIVVERARGLDGEAISHHFSVGRVLVGTHWVEVVPQLVEVDLAITVTITRVEDLLCFRCGDPGVCLA